MTLTEPEREILRQAGRILGGIKSKKKRDQSRENLKKYAWPNRRNAGRPAHCPSCGEDMVRDSWFPHLERPSFESDIVQGWSCPKCGTFRALKVRKKRAKKKAPVISRGFLPHTQPL
jgi:predicted RNA-binding Zn-ribbon protein involved in translation (DUF1610 family)